MLGYKNQGAKGSYIEDDRHVADTLQCVHCGAHWRVQVGSRKDRGFCMHCMGPLCGKDECFKCLPFENWLDLKERGETNIRIGRGTFRRVTIKEKPV